MRRDDPAVVPVLATLPLPCAPEQVIAALLPYVTPARLERIDRVVAGRTRRMVIVLDQTTDPHNAAAVLRSADAFGVHEVHVIAGGVEFSAPMRVAQGTAHWLDIVHHDSAQACADVLHGRGYRILIAAMDGRVTPTQLVEFTRVAVVFGNERLGVSDPMRALADGTYAIPMRGFVESLNVSVAAAITMHAATATRGGDLSLQEQQELRARFMLNSVERGAQIVNEILARTRTST